MVYSIITSMKNVRLKLNGTFCACGGGGTKFGIKIFEIGFVIENKWYLTFWPLPRAQGVGPNKTAAAHPIHGSNSHTKFGWISSNGLGGDNITDRQQDGI